jgi:hypothetical protein
VRGRIGGKEPLHGVAEDIAQMDVDRPGGPVIVDIGVEIHARVQKHVEGGEPGLMDGKALVGDDGVVDQPGEIDRSDGDAAHIGVAQDIVQIVGRVAARNDRLENIDPARDAGVVLAFLFQHHMGDVIRIQFFAPVEGARRAAADFFDEWSQMLAHDDLSQLLVGEAEAVQIVVIEEMAERAVPDVMHECRNPQEFLHERGGGKIGDGLSQKRIQVAGEPSGDMHGPQRVHEPRMFRGGIDPSGTLQLVDVSQPLDPGGVDQVLFRALGRIGSRVGHGERDVFMDRIGNKRGTVVGRWRNGGR